MTTIAYNHKDREIAVDSRISNLSGLIVNDKAVKHVKRNGQLFVSTFSGSDHLLLIDIYFGAKAERESYDATVMFTCDGVVFIMSYSEGQLDQWPLLENAGIGSGGDFALAAMDFGCNAKDAVKYAATRNMYTGGKITVFKV